MKIKYVADDGTTFDTAQDCTSYELLVSFGADAAFVNAVVDALVSVLTTSDRGYGIISFDDDEDQTKVAVALANNFEKLYEVYERIKAAANLKKAPDKRSIATKKAKSE